MCGTQSGICQCILPIGPPFPPPYVWSYRYDPGTGQDIIVSGPRRLGEGEWVTALQGVTQPGQPDLSGDDDNPCIVRGEE